jgi:uncharacterized membrane protein
MMTVLAGIAIGCACLLGATPRAQAQGLAAEWAGPGTSVGLPGGLKVHVAQGMWSQHWKLDEALADQCEITESFMCSRMGFVTSLKGFPMKKEDLLAEKVLILANIPVDAFTREGQYDRMADVPGRTADWVEEFVAQGGGLFVLGGNYSLGTGGGPIAGSAYAKCLPADIHQGDIVFATQDKPVELTPVGTHPILAGINWDQKPVTLFYHEVAPRPDMQVLVKAGDAPVLIAGTYGKGRVVLWTPTLHGEPAAPAVAYWQWNSWPQLVRNITQWLATPPG